MSRDPAQAGFSLLEVTVALAVLSLVLAGLAQGLQFGLSAWRLQARGISSRDELGAADRLLRGLIERMDPGAEGQDQPLRGLPGAMQFRTTLPMAAAALRMRVVEAGLGVDAGHRLMLRLLPNPHARRRVATTGVIEEALLEQVEAVQFTYWRLPDRGEAGAWLPAWTGRDLPGLIRLRIVFVTGSGRHWPDIVATPMRDRATP